MPQVISLAEYRAQHLPGPPAPPTPPPIQRRLRPLAGPSAVLRTGLWVLLPAVMMLLAVATGYVVVVMALLGGR